MSFCIPPVPDLPAPFFPLRAAPFSSAVVGARIVLSPANSKNPSSRHCPPFLPQRDEPRCLGVRCLSPSCAGDCERAGQPVPLPLLHLAQPELTSIPKQTVGRGKGQVCSAPLPQAGEMKCFLDSWCCPHTHPLLRSDLGREGKGSRRSGGAGTAAGGSSLQGYGCTA